MKHIALLTAGLIAISAPAQARSYKICVQEFALCAASPTTPTNKQISVNVSGGGTAQFPEGVAVCPVLHGPAIADVTGGNMKGSCDQPGDNQVWSLFQARRDIPQAPTYSRQMPAAYRQFVTTPGTGGLSNMFSFACTKIPRKGRGVQLANCYGPLNENLDGGVVGVGVSVITQAPLGVPYPVGGPLP